MGEGETGGAEGGRASRTTSSGSSCTARWPTRAGSIRPSIRTSAHPESTYLGDPRGGEHEPRRPGPVLHAAQLAFAVELRRRATATACAAAGHRRARAGDRQPRRRRVHAEPHPSALRRNRPSRQGNLRDSRRHPLLRRAEPEGTAAPRRRHLSPTGWCATDSRRHGDDPARSTAFGSSRSAR